LLRELHDRIVRNLIQVNEDDLILAIGDDTYQPLTQGWIEAAYVSFGADGTSGDNWLLQWPEHPAAAYFLDLNKVNKQQKVAILLPFSGRFSNVAKAVQKGLLTAAAADSENHNELIFYDTGSQGENVSNAWFTAQENQADLIIGPLDKSSIEVVEQIPAPTIPVVLLNQSEPESDYFQFTLSPEGEAIEVATKMINDGHKRVLIMAPNEPWGERMTQAFAQSFVDLGGQIVNNSYFQTKQNDYSAQLRQTLGLIESQLRARNLQQFLKLNLSADEVVRSDVDAIFLAARPDFARLMVPQLKFHHAANIPVYSTSHVFDGLMNEQHNRDLQGLRFALSPIELQSNALLETAAFDLGRVGGDKKLFAFGYDAYQLISRLEWMNRVNTGVVNGLSGKVSLGFDGVFNRGLLWAQYNNGSVVALPQ
ncbi:MAG: penicillin-binding protein activator, partial [Marinicella sp.]